MQLEQALSVLDTLHDSLVDADNRGNGEYAFYWEDDTLTNAIQALKVVNQAVQESVALREWKEKNGR